MQVQSTKDAGSAAASSSAMLERAPTIYVVRVLLWRDATSGIRAILYSVWLVSPKRAICDVRNVFKTLRVLEQSKDCPMQRNHSCAYGQAPEEQNVFQAR